MSFGTGTRYMNHYTSTARVSANFAKAEAISSRCAVMRSLTGPFRFKVLRWKSSEIKRPVKIEVRSLVSNWTHNSRSAIYAGGAANWFT